jgi:hypothetical protein
VDNIRSYMDILDWVAADAGPPAQREAANKPSGTNVRSGS